MRRPVFVAILAGSLLVACSDQPTEVPAPPQAPAPQLDVGPSTCSLNSLLDLTKALFPPSPTLNLVIATLKGLPTKPQLRLSRAIHLTVFGILDAVTKAYAANRLFGGKSAQTQANLLAFINGLYCFVGLPQPNIPVGALDPNEGAVVVLTPNSGPTLVRPASKHGGIFFPAGAAPVPTTITISRLPDSPGPLLTSLNQFPLFYEFSSTPAVTFNSFVTTAVCLGDAFTLTTPRIAHNVGTTFGAVEVLPTASASGVVDCTDLQPSVIGSRWGIRGLFAAVFMPSELHASSTTLLPAVGGTTKRFSPFGAVDAASNPGTLGYNPDAGTFSELSAAPGGSVSPPPSVIVTSQNGTPIANVPVVFAVTSGGGTINDGATSTTVTTGADGIASLGDWTLGSEPGTNTVTATPPAGAQVGTPSAAFTPAVAFNPASLTFTAEAQAPVGNLAHQSCTLEGGPTGLRSLNSATPVDVMFVNNSSETVSVYWLDFNGQRNYPAGQGVGFPYMVLASGQSYTQATFLTHPWVLVGNPSGYCYGIFVPSTSGGTVTIVGPPA